MPGGSVTDWSRRRVALSRAGNIYARLMLGLPIHDATSGYRVYRAPLLEALMRRPFAADGYGFQVELVLRSHRLGYAVGESPITFRDRAFGESKISNAIVRRGAVEGHPVGLRSAVPFGAARLGPRSRPGPIPVQRP